MNDLFVIAAGGTGAKVSESLIHLCAAGMGPENVHILLVDGDVNNGNRVRTVETWQAYERMHHSKDKAGQETPWPWAVRCQKNAAVGARLFRSRIWVYALAERFDAINEVGLMPQIGGDEQLKQALSVLLDEDELTADLGIGFAGRPNLGCLVIDQYLRRNFAKHREARMFLKALEKSASPEISAARVAEAGPVAESARPENSAPRVVVVGSVFGGTGASLLPVVQPCIESIFSEPDPQDPKKTPRGPLIERMRWGKVMQLPYFSPDGSVGTDGPNVNRHLADTSSALWYYGETRREGGLDPTYLIGSAAPHLRRTRAAKGGSAQVNPPFYHEILAALAILHFYDIPEVEHGLPIRHFSKSETAERCSLDDLPVPAGLGKRAVLLEKLALLLHVAAFWTKWRPDDSVAYRCGLLQFAKDATLSGWDASVHGWLKNRKKELTDKNSYGDVTLEYFGRLLLWATSSLSRHGATGLAFQSEDEEHAHYYSSLHNTLCEIPLAEICVGEGQLEYKEQHDNLAARLCRLAAAGLLRENSAHESKSDLRGHPYHLAALRLVENAETIRLGLAPNSLGENLATHNLDRQKVVRLCDSYILPEQKPDEPS